MYFLIKNGYIPASYVSLPEGIVKFPRQNLHSLYAKRAFKRLTLVMNAVGDDELPSYAPKVKQFAPE